MYRRQINRRNGIAFIVAEKMYRVRWATSRGAVGGGNVKRNMRSCRGKDRKGIGMAVKVDISKLNDLRKEVAVLLQRAYDLGEPEERSTKTVPASARLVVVLRRESLILCYRVNKEDGDVEIVVVSKMDANDGPTPRRCDKYEAKIAAFLEKRGLYQDRGAITDKTPSLFEEEK